jgi:hypothetical protein
MLGYRNTSMGMRNNNNHDYGFSFIELINLKYLEIYPTNLYARLHMIIVAVAK